ncbi:putative Zn-binding protein involved in type VI secretion [Oxalobacteraceae bacterium GrIS 1.11]
MAGPLIRLGDKTSHGGTVIEASPHTASGGKGIARVGDNTSCPKKGHGTNPIASGDPTMIVDGKPVARHGDTTACGAVLISSQQNTTDLV